MTSFTKVLIAQNNFCNAIHAVAMKKWTAVQVTYQKLQSSLINQKIDANATISATYGCMWGAYIRSVKDEPIRKLIDTVKKLTDKDVTAQIALFFAGQGKDLVDPVAQLRKAPLEDKRTYLRAIPVISAPVAAAYLGVTTGAINSFTAEHSRAVGDRYARGYCLSMDEVFLIEKNPQWLVGVVSPKGADEVEAFDNSAFDSLLYVGADLACAFTDMTLSELRKAVKVGPQAMRPFRLSDLEKIRVAKLNAEKH